MKLEIEVPLKPIPKARPRFFTHKGKLRVKGAYTPPLTKNFEQTVRYYVLLAISRSDVEKANTLPCRLRIEFYRMDIGRTDIDNLLKSVMDALRGVLYKDDRQVVSLEATKKRAEREEDEKVIIFWEVAL